MFSSFSYLCSLTSPLVNFFSVKKFLNTLERKATKTEHNLHGFRSFFKRYTVLFPVEVQEFYIRATVFISLAVLVLI